MSDSRSGGLVLPADMDLDALIIGLNRLHIEHRLVRDDSGTHLWLEDPEDGQRVVELIQQIQRTLALETQLAAVRPSGGPVVLAYLTRLPVTIIALTLCILGTVVVRFWPDLVSWLTFQGFSRLGDQLVLEPVSAAMSRNEWWRLLTPVFLHFGIFHIVFNGLWLWEFGRRVELLTGSGAYLLLLSGTAIGSNVGQYLWSGPSLFGGFSGVVYGLLGYIWVRNKRRPHPLLQLPGAIFPLMIGWLLICLSGVIDLFIAGGVANGAHVTGLLIGMSFGAVAGQRRQPMI